MEIESYIYLDEVRFYAFHGVMPQETQVGGEFLVSLRVGYPIQGAMETDDVADTLNYAELFQLVKQQMDIPSQQKWGYPQQGQGGNDGRPPSPRGL